MPVQHWSPKQVKEFAKQIRTSEVGKAWPFLAPAIQHAIVSEKVLTIIRLQARDSVDVAAIDDLYERLHTEMGTSL